MRVTKTFTCSGHRSAIYALAAGRHAREVLSGGGEGWVVAWNLDDPETGRLLAAVNTRIFSLLHIPERDLCIAGNMDGGLHWIRIEDPQATRNISHHRKGVFDLLPLGEYLFSAGGEGLLTRWSLTEQRSLESLHLSNQSLRALAYSDIRNELAVGASDGCIYLLDAATLAIERRIQQAHANSVFTLAYTPDQTHLVSGGRDAMLKVWNLENPETPVREQAAHWYTLNHVVFSPDGALMATASRDKTVKIWDARSFELRKVMDAFRYGAHLNSVNRLLWLPDILVSAGDDRSMCLWEIGAENQMEQG